MAECEHIGWIQFADKKVTCRDGGRLDRLLPDMTNPATQRPSLFFFISRKAKNEALPYLFPHNHIKKGVRDGLACLRIDNASVSTDHPVLFADSDPASNHFASIIPQCHGYVSHPLC